MDNDTLVHDFRHVLFLFLSSFLFLFLRAFSLRLFFLGLFEVKLGSSSVVAIIIIIMVPLSSFSASCILI